jgi:hypothetical protein
MMCNDAKTCENLRKLANKDECWHQRSSWDCFKRKPKEHQTADPLGSNELAGSVASPWPLRDIVAKLVEAADILLDDKSYDGHGWEQIQVAKTEAAKWLKQ